MTLTSHAMEIFRQGVWASLTGGWCYDPRQSLACNIVHMYLWLFLFALPLLIVLCFNLTWPVIGAYALVVGIVFSVLKISNYYLHTIFDTHEPIDVVVATNVENDRDGDENGEQDLEAGLTMAEESYSDVTSRSRSRRIQSDVGSDARTSTLHEMLAESSLGESSLEITELRRGGRDMEYAVRVPKSTEMAIKKTLEEQAEENGTIQDQGSSNPKEQRSRSSDKSIDCQRSTDYLAVEVDVHSMPNELTDKDDVVDVENIELRTVRSDSKLVSSKAPEVLRKGCCSLTTEALTPECQDGQSVASGKKIFFASGTEIGVSKDTIGDRMKASDDLDDDVDDDETPEASSSRLDLYKRKYSEPYLVVNNGVDSDTKRTGKRSENDEDDFDRIRRPTSIRKGTASAVVDGNNAVRRTRSSTVETSAQRRTSGRDKADSIGEGMAATSSTLLSETCLEKCRGKGVRKSYPGKTSSTDIFLRQLGGIQQEPTIAEGLRRIARGSNSMESSRTGLEGSSSIGVEDPSGESQTISPADEESGRKSSSVANVTRYFSVDVPLTGITERDSESERQEGAADFDVSGPNSYRVTSVDWQDGPPSTTDRYGTGRTDDYGTCSSFYATASEGSASAAPSEFTDRGNTRRRRWMSSDDPPVQSPKTKLIQNLRNTLETLKSAAPITASSPTSTVSDTDRFVADLRALKDASTPDLRWLFDDAAAVLTTSSCRHPAVSSADNSPVARPRVNSLQSKEVDAAAVHSKERGRVPRPSLPSTSSRLCSPVLRTDVSLIQHQFRERMMEEIKRLLEEIIDSHPEALEAIESVRQAKLARIAGQPTTVTDGGKRNTKGQAGGQFMDDEEDDDGTKAGPSHRARRGHRSGHAGHVKASTNEKSRIVVGEEAPVDDGMQTTESTYDGLNEMSTPATGPTTASANDADCWGRNSALAALAKKRNVHVARSHDDTAEGAVHYFQDGDGKWYTYAFNAEGVATAQLLGSDRALMELIVQQQAENEATKSSHRKKRSRPRVDRDGADSSARRQDPSHIHGSWSSYGGSQRRIVPPTLSRMVLARTGSSSSEESYMALDAPASILHVGRTGGNARAAATSLSISLGPLTLPPADLPSGGRVTLPLRLRQQSGGGVVHTAGLPATSAATGGRRRRSGANSFGPLRQTLNRSGGASAQFLASPVGFPVLPRRRSGSLTSGRDTGDSVITTALSPQNMDDLPTPGEYSAVGTHGNMFAFRPSLRTPSDLSHPSFRARFFATLAGGVEGLPSMIGAAHTLAGNGPHGKTTLAGPSAKRKQYYRVALCPEVGTSCCPTWITARFRALKSWAASNENDGTASKGIGCVCCPRKTFKLSLDRLRLMALFDRNHTKFSAFIDVVLAVLVAFVACGILSRPLFYDLQLVLACVVTAGAQFSLMKSVQPDAASPVHGYNALVAYSRPVYYCLFGTTLYALDRYLAYHPSNPYATETLYSSWPEKWQCRWSTLKDFLAALFLFFPVVFSFGLLPQLNTFVIYFLEQVEMLVFGGTACVGLASGFFSVSRSLVVSSLLFTLNYFSAQLHPLRPVQNIIFSAFVASLVSCTYLLSRSSSDPKLLGVLLAVWRTGSSPVLEKTPSREELQNSGNRKEDVPSVFHSDATASAEYASVDTSNRRREFSLSTQDPLPGQIAHTMMLRLEHDCVVGSILAVIYFALHCSTVLVEIKSTSVGYVLPLVTVMVGFVGHYFLPQLRQHTPWRALAAPLLRSHEHRMFDVDSMAKLMSFERLYAMLNILERNVLYPLVVLYFITVSGQEILTRYGIAIGSILISISSMKLLRTGFCNAAQLYLPLGAATLFSYIDYPSISLTVLLDFYLAALLYPKFMELVLKLQFIFSYVAPWQISWGSAFHAFAQPTAIPHSAFTLAIATVSSFLSAPLNPFLGSAVFLMSYVRPVKFWEKNYNTKRIDNSNTRLISQIDRGPMTDDSNLNAIFYEHLTRSLQRSLAGDVQLGRLATSVSSGDCFILASFYLNCLVHVIEVGNGFVTFQLRGLEFRGTYCQQREVEAINEEIADQGCCCCGGDGGTSCCIRGFLSFNSLWSLSWLSWRVTASKFVIEGYSVSDNSALNLLQVIELRRLLVTLYVKCIIFYALKSTRLDEWLCTDTIVAALEPVTKDSKYVDADPSFCAANDEDYDCNLNGISRHSFCQLYLPWIEYCYARRRQTKQGVDGNGEEMSCEKDSLLTALCFGLSLLGRRVLGAAAQGRHTTGAESFVYGLHALFKGDFRITSSRDEWIFADMDMLKSVIAPAVRMALKLHQDHFTVPDDFESMSYLYGMIDHYDRSIFISHENDPAWRHAVLNNTRSLLALRHVFEDGQDDFKIIMLNRRHMSFRVIALNKECVRAFWAGQQQELIFLRNRNPERGSIQNARQVLRNMINSSADQPIGYPIYVSPLTTSFCETHEGVVQCTGPALTTKMIGSWFRGLWHRLISRCETSGSSNLATHYSPAANIAPATAMGHFGATDSRSGDGRVAETSLVTGRNTEPRQYQWRRTRPIIRPRTSHLTAPRRSEQAAATGSRATGLTQPSQHRHGSAPPVMQRSMTHPLRGASVTGQVFRFRQHNHQFVQLSPARSQDSVSPPVPSNSVVSTGSNANSSESSSGQAPQVCLGSLLALSVPDRNASTSTPTSQRRGQRVRIVDVSASVVLDHLDTLSSESLSSGSFVWPREEWRLKGGRQSWKEWKPEKGMEGSVVHKWTSLYSSRRGVSYDKTILLLNVLDGKYYVPIFEEGVEWIGDEL